MAASLPKAAAAVSEQIDAIRELEASDDAWFALPEEGDDDVNWMSFQVEISGPEEYASNPKGGAEKRPSPFKGGIFRVLLTIPDSYPREAPRVMFRTRVWHPNVNQETGKPCMEGLTDEWKPTNTILDVLKYVRGLLAEPNAADHVNGEAAREMLDDVDKFDAHAAAETRKYACE